MKRLLSLCVVLAVVCSLAGCCCVTSRKAASGTLSDEEDHVNMPIENDAAEETKPIFGDDETESWYDEPEILETEPEENEIYIDLNTQYKLNLFLSNFAEANIQQYPCCTYHMLRFVLSHCQINGVGDVEYIEGEAVFSKDTADTILYKYTAGMIYEDDNYSEYPKCSDFYDSFIYSNGYYYYPAGGAEHTGYVAIADAMYQNSDGSYTVYYNVYTVEADYTHYYDISEFYSYTPSQAASDRNLYFTYSAVAVVQDYTRPGGQESYQLLSLERF